MTQITSPHEVSPDNRSLLEKLESFSDFPQFWEEESDEVFMDPQLKAEQDKEVEAFRVRLEEMNQNSTNKRVSMEDSILSKLREICQHSRIALYPSRIRQ
eukprot:TRINITY_DN14848_c0_g1_i1.p1 TRINITY_DN14848_c0_g1~~TRINITY_DN14848_c0_g1_i1.p1  ORF type:complete len:100 (-),score=28.04 TRINITY_DN14848_c0_g1_i1:85-384(-)